MCAVIFVANTPLKCGASYEVSAVLGRAAQAHNYPILLPMDAHLDAADTGLLFKK